MYPFSPYDQGFAVNIITRYIFCVIVLLRRMHCVRFFVTRQRAQKYLGGIHIANKELQANEEIREKEVRVVNQEGQQLGVMSSEEALALAQSKGLDLVNIAPMAQPPVCKIMNFGKYRFELQKREKENRKNQKIVNIKEVQLSPSIDTNDFNTKCRNAAKFLSKGDKVKVTVRFRGREVSHSEIGEALLARFAESVSESGSVERPAKLEGRNMTMFLAPNAQ